MKLLVILFLSLPLLLYGQSDGFVIRTNNLPASGYRYGYAEQLENGTILTLKQRIQWDINDDYQRILSSEIVIIDTVGNILRQVNLVSDSLQNMGSQMFKINNGYIVSGLFYSSAYNYAKVIFFDKDLNKLSEEMTVVSPHQKVPLGWSDCWYNSFQTELANGDLIVISQFLCTDGKIIFKRFSKDGHLVESKTVDPTSPDLVTYISIVHTDFNRENIYLHNDSGQIFKFDSNFTLITKMGVNDLKPFINKSLDIIPLKEKYLYYGQLEYPINEENFYEIVLGNLSLDFDLIQDDTTQLFNFVPYDFYETTSFWSKSFFRLKDSTFIGFIQTVNFLTTPNAVVVQRFDRNLMHHSEIKYVFDLASLVIYCASLTPDQQLLIAGDYLTMPLRTDHFYPSEGFIMKFGIHDEAPLSGKKHSGLPHGIISIVRNPVHDYLTLEQSETARDYHVNILDLTGKVLISKQPFNAPQLQIPVGGFPPGVYMYVITEGSRQVDSGKFVKQ